MSIQYSLYFSSCFVTSLYCMVNKYSEISLPYMQNQPKTKMQQGRSVSPEQHVTYTIGMLGKQHSAISNLCSGRMNLLLFFLLSKVCMQNTQFSCILILHHGFLLFDVSNTLPVLYKWSFEASESLIFILHWRLSHSNWFHWLFVY